MWPTVLSRLLLAVCGLFFAVGILFQDVGGPGLTMALGAFAAAMLGSAILLSPARGWSWWLAIVSAGSLTLVFACLAVATPFDEGWRNQYWYYRRWGPMLASIAPELGLAVSSALFVRLLFYARQRARALPPG